ncbi:uncharacterized protein LOC136080174 [Hydra vulgaris]|uniref:Uncharacterized protein LOC136080174 n=1 Tax=Hydra vulgaris TaxID=6087 RepID=A0ABM4BUK1_HYDVU
MLFTDENNNEFNAAISCHICGEKLNEDKVRDHSHITGKYRVLFHNLSGYDSHLFIKKLSGGKLSYIPNNEEKYISFSREIKVGEFINKEDDSLDASSKNLEKDKCKNIDISDDDYSHAQFVWKEFNCKTFRDYHDLYNVSDVLLLADVFENFRDLCINIYDLDPAWYYTSPELAWDAALKKKKKLEFLSDYDMILMIKKGIRGGISMISNRFGTSNNKYMGDAYDQSTPSTFIQYLDANNLYGWAMSKPLPTNGFKWMDDYELTYWKSIPCILKVDLDYPKHLHDEHNDYPLAPERITIDQVKKLVPSLNNKKNYVIHYENLKLYERLGLKITKIHRGIKFQERNWLSEYIELNTKLRAKATNKFGIEFFKLMNNQVFKKTMENIENRVDIRLVTNRNEAIKLASKPNFESRTIFDENLLSIHMKRTKLTYAKAIYLGMCILDLSKTLMYKFYYDYIKKKYSDQAKLLSTDTDFLAYEIKKEDFYADISKDIESKFGTSEFDKNHPAINKVGFKVGTNNKVLGMFKDEAKAAQIKEFLGLRSKLYSYKVHGEEKKKCKGVKINVIKKDNLPKNTQRKECEILNTVDSCTKGFHWICWYKDGDKKLSFDSYGLPPPVEVVNYLKNPVYYNSDRVQFGNTSFCGLTRRM